MAHLIDIVAIADSAEDPKNKLFREPGIVRYVVCNQKYYVNTQVWVPCLMPADFLLIAKIVQQIVPHFAGLKHVWGFSTFQLIFAFFCAFIVKQIVLHVAVSDFTSFPIIFFCLIPSFKNSSK